jgi:putative transposase
VGTVSRNTLDRWMRDYRTGRLAGLEPRVRADAGVVRRHPELFEEAAALRMERPERSAAHIAEILRARHGIRVSERTLREQLQRRGLDRAQLAAQHRTFGRFEASRPNEIWIGDVLVGPFVPHPRVEGSRRARLFAFLDDHSRLLVHGAWVSEENTRAGQLVLRAAILRRGLPVRLYLDNGAPFSNANLERTCGVLGIHLVHSRPGMPQGRGKVERIFRVIRERFLLEAEQAGIPDLQTLNDRFTAWVEQYLNTRVHSETNQVPIERFLATGPPPKADPQLLEEACRWSELRRVDRTACVNLLGNRYRVDPALCGRRVELRYDPEDLRRLTVHLEGLPAGDAVPFVVGRHVHPAVPQAARPPAQPTGVDYLGLIEVQHAEQTLGPIAFRRLAEDEEDA